MSHYTFFGITFFSPHFGSGKLITTDPTAPLYVPDQADLDNGYFQINNGSSSHESFEIIKLQNYNQKSSCYIENLNIKNNDADNIVHVSSNGKATINNVSASKNKLTNE